MQTDSAQMSGAPGGATGRPSHARNPVSPARDAAAGALDPRFYAGFAGVRDRAELARYMGALCRELRANAYMVLAGAHDHGREPARILASNWTFDAIQTIGAESIAQLAAGSAAADLGSTPVAFLPQSGRRAPLLHRQLRDNGHHEIYCLKLHAGRRRCHVLFSAARPGAIDASRLSSAQLMCCYVLSTLAAELFDGGDDPLSERERECLFWVAEGKTSDEVATILGVTANTVNSYLANALQKFAASNRAMAIAAAIRSGAI